MRKEKRRVADANPALSTTTPLVTTPILSDVTDDFDYDKRIVDRVDESIWRALFNGSFRLAVKCDRCGRWLTDGHSKRDRLGPVCAAKEIRPRSTIAKSAARERLAAADKLNGKLDGGDR